MNNPNNDEAIFPDAKKVAEERRLLFINSLPEEIRLKEDEIAKKLHLENSSRRAKLHKIYNLMSEIMATSETNVACTNGCSACCNMNVMVSQVEADFMSEKTGFKPAKLNESKRHSLDRFAAVPCPFLKNNSCSIYPFRPFVCRKHVSFATSAYWCESERMSKFEFPQVSFSGPESAMMELMALDKGGIVADIRDFFPGNY